MGRNDKDGQNKENQQKTNPNKMKAITTRIQKFSRPGVILMATVVVIITSMVVANATQTFATPNSAYITYSLAAGANSATITPIASKSVLVMGCCTTTTPNIVPGVGQVSLLRIASSFIEWAGLESFSPAAITSGSSSAAGTHIVYINS